MTKTPLDNTPAEQPEGAPKNSAAEGYSLATHFIMTTLVGCGLGWGVDSLTGTVPLFLIIGLFFGVAAGMYKLIQGTKK